MGLPEQEPTAAEALAWLDRDAGNQVFSIANSWYTRRRWGQPFLRHDSLRDAIGFAMANHEMREAAAKWGGR
jgi:hypothetical protein